MVYVEKIAADAVDDEMGNRRQACVEFLLDFMLNKYGLKGLADNAVRGMLDKLWEFVGTPKARIYEI